MTHAPENTDKPELRRKTPKRPRDPNQLAKLITDIATGKAQEEPEKEPVSRPDAGLMGGRARAKSLSPEERSEIATKAARARWDKR